MDWTIIVTSAAVGAVVATLGQLLGQMLQRRHRERELTFRFAIQAARSARSTAITSAERRGTTLAVPDELYLAADYYPLVQRLLRRGRHPREIKPEVHRNDAG